MANAGQSWATGPLFSLKTGCPNEILVVSGNWATTNLEHWRHAKYYSGKGKIFDITCMECSLEYMHMFENMGRVVQRTIKVIQD